MGELILRIMLFVMIEIIARILFYVFCGIGYLIGFAIGGEVGGVIGAILGGLTILGGVILALVLTIPAAAPAVAVGAVMAKAAALSAVAAVPVLSVPVIAVLATLAVIAVTTLILAFVGNLLWNRHQKRVAAGCSDIAAFDDAQLISQSHELVKRSMGSYAPRTEEVKTNESGLDQEKSSENSNSRAVLETPAPQQEKSSEVKVSTALSEKTVSKTASKLILPWSQHGTKYVNDERKPLSAILDNRLEITKNYCNR